MYYYQDEKWNKYFGFETLEQVTNRLKALTAIVSQNFWWPINRRHYIRLYLQLPIPRFNNIIPCASGRYSWSNMNFNNSAARRVPPWSWPKSYNPHSKSGDWVPTLDHPIPSNGDWPKFCVTVFVSIRDTFHLAGLHMKTPTVQFGSCL